MLAKQINCKFDEDVFRDVLECQKFETHCKVGGKWFPWMMLLLPVQHSKMQMLDMTTGRMAEKERETERESETIT